MPTDLKVLPRRNNLPSPRHCFHCKIFIIIIHILCFHCKIITIIIIYIDIITIVIISTFCVSTVRLSLSLSFNDNIHIVCFHCKIINIFWVHCKIINIICFHCNIFLSSVSTGRVCLSDTSLHFTPKIRRGERRVKGRLELFQNFICFGRVRLT